MKVSVVFGFLFHAVVIAGPHHGVANANPDDGSKYKILEPDVKCASDDRLFRTPDSTPYTIDQCYQRCYETQGCKYFSFGHDPLNEEYSGLCMGCIGGSTHFPVHTGFSVYEMHVLQDFQGGNFLFARDLKCSDRLFRTPDDSPLTFEQCNDKCVETEGCQYFALGEGGPDNFKDEWMGVCIGCSADAPRSAHPGFNFYKVDTMETTGIPTSPPSMSPSALPTFMASLTPTLFPTTAFAEFQDFDFPLPGLTTVTTCPWHAQSISECSCEVVQEGSGETCSSCEFCSNNISLDCTNLGYTDTCATIDCGTCVNPTVFPNIPIDGFSTHVLCPTTSELEDCVCAVLAPTNSWCTSCSICSDGTVTMDCTNVYPTNACGSLDCGVCNNPTPPPTPSPTPAPCRECSFSLSGPYATCRCCGTSNSVYMGFLSYSSSSELACIHQECARTWYYKSPNSLVNSCCKIPDSYGRTVPNVNLLSSKYSICCRHHE